MNQRILHDVVAGLRRGLLALLLGAVWSVGWAPMALAQTFQVPEEVPTWEAWEAPPLPDDWIAVRGAGFTLHGARAHLGLMDRLIAHGDQAVPRIAGELGIPLGGEVEVYLAGSQEEFQRLQPGNPPVWADGTAYPNLGIIFLRHPSLRGGGARPLEQVLDHELVHVLLGRVFAPHPSPRWLQEGLAQVYAGEVGPEIAQRIARGSLGRRPLPLESLTEGFPADGQLADLAYAQSADFILWFRGSYGEQALRDLLRQMGAGLTARQAIHKVTGVPLEQLGAVWLARLEVQTSGTIAPEHLESAVYGLGGLGLALAGWSRRRAFRRRMENWEEEDEALDGLTRELLAQRRSQAPASRLSLWR